MAKQTETKIIKEMSYCKIYNKVSIEDDDYFITDRNKYNVKVISMYDKDGDIVIKENAICICR
ncbi:hypothetical protein [Clostridium saccharobutylicum]|uniref:Uncharacterized protein n=1 Tax=Clostridium saccharobutylicum DSM 13864 TaxID=1345695 RepID=U5MY18_CLOSA|nr:hypothetical protein [Clostridium saccharobutylicum]AGX45428.1 hypothetical protein CLSA_c45010 [Clostridium saccharobutylicum DSM 13864]AQR92701.1 hypothetical protein CLOSC_44640 [Clostridium saccharobutylicum]AQS02603.1 hypothetical protein CSACC_44690 [Clostridium saccharobutylicum]AQS12209.1 hypothetical protein CLOBY_44020 [Clostridium saccharobutylicum]AQS16586.1 hypothetical protein CLOSACC_44690 [Clostridium saccharobutylicum]